jgi:small nuclear ribonucleoprotein (snRNP)-like protein
MSVKEEIISSSSSSSTSPKSSPKSSSGDELSVYSMRFDPTKAFSYSEEVIKRLPFPRTRRLNNLHQYRQVAFAGDPEDFEKNMLLAIQQRPLGRKSKKYVDPNAPREIERKFLPHQMPISTKQEEVEINNLITRMNEITGPLAKLREYRDTRVRVCVKTRNIYHGMNEMIGFIVAFDKHWNLAIEDVAETFTRKRKRKVPIELGPKSENKLSNEELAKRGLVRPLVVKRINKKLELCKRHIPQLLIRGEHVILVTPAI